MAAPIPLLDLAAQHAPIQAELRAAFDRVLSSAQFVLGPDVAAFEAELAAHLGAKYAVGCASGSDALVLALLALDVGPGDDVLTSTFSFFATAGAIARIGARPIFADVDPQTFNLDVADAARKLTPKTKVILPVHLFGQMTPMGPVLELARSRGLRVVEDAAQSIGATENGGAAGTIGDAGIFSFFPSKNLGALGDAGAVITGSESIAARVRSLRVHGGANYLHREVGMNSRLDSLQAAMLRVKLPHVERWIEGRRRVAREYDARFSGMSSVVTPRTLAGMRHTHHQYTIRVPRRDALERRFRDEQIGCAIYYPVPLHLQECFAKFGGKPGDCPNAEKICSEVLSLPVYGELESEELDRIARTVGEHLRVG